MTEQEQKAFTAMREALKSSAVCIQLMSDGPSRASWGDTLDIIDAALAAANAVSEQAQEPKLPEYFAQYEYAPDFSVVVSVYRRRSDDVPELIHSEALPKQIDDHPQATEPAGWKLTDEHLQAAIYCREAGHVSVSLVQRKLKTGYNAAQEICQHIINAGLVPGLKIAPSLTTAAAPEAP